MFKVYLKPTLEDDNAGRGIMRVVDALIANKPENVEITDKAGDADLAILHVWGRHETTQKQIDWLKARKIPYAIIQYCLRSTMEPSTKDWIDMWRGARLVWSYYDLHSLCREDGINDFDFNFYHAPLGADANVFQDKNKMGVCKACRGLYDEHDADTHPFEHERHYVILASSQHALSESAKECVLATKHLAREMLFLGHDLRRGADIVCVSGIKDSELAELYSDSQFVSGLRRTEGFELPAVEGLLCGARPILFDKPHYRTWYDGLAEFIPEGDRTEVVDALIELFKVGPKPVSMEEIALAKQIFNWETIIGEFYERAL